MQLSIAKKGEEPLPGNVFVSAYEVCKMCGQAERVVVGYNGSGWPICKECHELWGMSLMASSTSC